MRPLCGGRRGWKRGHGWRTAATHRQLSDGNCCCARAHASLQEYERSNYHPRLTISEESSLTVISPFLRTKKPDGLVHFEPSTLKRQRESSTGLYRINRDYQTMIVDTPYYNHVIRMFNKPYISFKHRSEHRTLFYEQRAVIRYYVKKTNMTLNITPKADKVA